MSRVQLALNVDDLETSVAFYSKLFDAAPAKVRPGYANFAIAEPPLKLVLIENPGEGGSLNHLGVEVSDVDSVDTAQARLAGHGLVALDNATLFRQIQELATQDALTGLFNRRHFARQCVAFPRRSLDFRLAPHERGKPVAGACHRRPIDASERRRICHERAREQLVGVRPSHRFQRRG